MRKKKVEPEKVSTCFEGRPGAEMILKIMDAEGIGSLSEKMMKALTATNEVRIGKEKTK